MADEADRADEYIETERQRQIEAARQSAQERPPSGRCRFCKEELDPWESYCDSDCRDDFEREQAAKRRNGRL